jgi:hypothetical protein
VLLWGVQQQAGQLAAYPTIPTSPQAPAAAAAAGGGGVTQVFLHPEPPPLLTVQAVADVVTFEPTPGDVICESTHPSGGVLVQGLEGWQRVFHTHCVQMLIE